MTTTKDPISILREALAEIMRTADSNTHVWRCARDAMAATEGAATVDRNPYMNAEGVICLPAGFTMKGTPNGMEYWHGDKLMWTDKSRAAIQPSEHDEPTHKNHPGHHDGHTCEAMGQMLGDFGSQRTTPEKVVARMAAIQPEGEVPKSNDGKEQDAFEAWASGERYDMTTHPLHWLFLNERTGAARQGWKAALEYVNKVIASPVSAPVPEAPGMPDMSDDMLTQDQMKRNIAERKQERCTHDFKHSPGFGGDFCAKCGMRETAPVPDAKAEQWTDANDICKLPPEGWYCTRKDGHDGPCAAHQHEPDRELDADDHACIADGMARLKSAAPAVKHEASELTRYAETSDYEGGHFMAPSSSGDYVLLSDVKALFGSPSLQSAPSIAVPAADSIGDDDEFLYLLGEHVHWIVESRMNRGGLAKSILATKALFAYIDARSPVAAAPAPDTSALYNELLFAVGMKYPGETRHQTALRYIRRCEKSLATAASSGETGAM